MKIVVEVEVKGVRRVAGVLDVADLAGALSEFFNELPKQLKERLREKLPENLAYKIGEKAREIADDVTVEPTSDGWLVCIRGPRSWLFRSTRPHEIRPVHAHALRFIPRDDVDVRPIFAKRVQHPGTRAKYDLVKLTLDSLEDLLPEILQETLNEILG